MKLFGWFSFHNLELSFDVFFPSLTTLIEEFDFLMLNFLSWIKHWFSSIILNEVFELLALRLRLDFNLEQFLISVNYFMLLVYNPRVIFPILWLYLLHIDIFEFRIWISFIFQESFLIESLIEWFNHWLIWASLKIQVKVYPITSVFDFTFPIKWFFLRYLYQAHHMESIYFVTSVILC